MPAIDVCHPPIVRALQKDGWTVEPQPLPARVGRRRALIDISASRTNNGTSQQILLAEVKCFQNRASWTNELYTAIGQYIVYRTMLQQLNMQVPLYLALPEDASRALFDSTVERVIRDNQIKLLIVNLATETIVQWRE